MIINLSCYHKVKNDYENFKMYFNDYEMFELYNRYIVSYQQVY